MGKISLKSEEEIKVMAEGGKKLGEILFRALKKVAPGVSTLEINNFIEEEILKFGGFPSFKTVPGYYWTSCIGFNEEVVHSIPRKEKIVKEGDLVKIDLGMVWQGLHTDQSWTIIAGRGDREKEKFLLAGEIALEAAIKEAKPGNRVGHISQKIQEIIEGYGYFPVRILTGHGIGRTLHEEPMIPGILTKPLEKTPLLEPGMTLAIEVIYSFSTPEVVLENDGWTVCTKDGKISGLFEKTIAVTKEEPLILTPLSLGKEEENRGSFYV